MGFGFVPLRPSIPEGCLCLKSLFLVLVQFLVPKFWVALVLSDDFIDIALLSVL